MTSEQRSRSPRADDLVAYALGEATPSRARRIESRLADDEALRVRLAEIRQVLRLTRELPDPSPSVALRARILAMTREARSADSVTAEPRLRWTEWPAFVAAYLRIRLHTSAGFRTFTVATAVALHVILLTAIAGLTVARLRSEPSSPHISMAPPSASEGETEDLIALDRILPKAEPDIDVQAPRFRDPAEKAPDVVPDALTSEPEIHTVPADLWSEVPGRENRLVLGRWFLFARHRGDRRANRSTPASACPWAGRRGVGRHRR